MPYTATAIQACNATPRSCGLETCIPSGRHSRRKVSIAINNSLTGIPYWETDIGGFVPMKLSCGTVSEMVSVRSLLCAVPLPWPTWKLRLPWRWNTGDPGPIEIRNYDGAAIPDATQLHNPQVKPICRKHLELRYRMLPYIYSAVRECTLTPDRVADHAGVVVALSR